MSSAKAIENYYKDPKYCKQCLKVIEVRPGKGGVTQTKLLTYCSGRCSAIANVSPYKKTDNYTYETSGPCEICKVDVPFKLRKGILYKRRKRCDDHAKVKSFKTLPEEFKLNVKERAKLPYSKKQSPKEIALANTTKDELFQQKKTYFLARATITSNAKTVYRRGDRPKECIICAYSLHHEVCHIKSVSSFDGSAKISEINDIHNLIALCPTHHWEFDNNHISIETINERIALL